jgi:C-terminal processing protease CtpA/Prc
VNGIVPGSPLDGSGVQKGDQFLEIWPNGTRRTLHAKDLSTTVNLIRGEPDSQLMLRVLRHNQSSGQLEEHLVQITRGQLYLNENTLPDRFVPAPRL